MLNDLISRQDAIDALKNRWKKTRHYEGIGDDIAEECELYLKQVPPAQSERPKGEWIYGEHDIAMCDGYWCDQCGFFVPWDYKHKFIDFIKDYHWCPSCGADMRGKQDE